MKKEYIEKAAKEALLNDSTEFRNTKIGTFQQGFVVGAEWRINSVWHDMKEEIPQIYGDYGDLFYPQIPCLVRGMLSTGYGYGVRYWNVTEQCWDDEDCDDYECGKDKIEEWAYLDDLLPERKEETNGSR